ncbi:DUF1772 domain-containing protein [Rhodococcus triatomae]|uniref:Uncharacterized membrane protein n=1 Tax=Rhodococcus triatomae TaxID=300028 RepID=A0A1G8GGU5_9NOCA|nr:anthrone oxygenase family protein [Rhodococcus triatomae]QNG20384.1 DUF1772 domain-containing protein [Rhodococcus triatomae]QNG23700.1 DUF1772 domain-containing protein [Rhodococcus triatomae]SDH93550.1 Uncharacterized membrane protein [Rhodococcus triatomae]
MSGTTLLTVTATVATGVTAGVYGAFSIMVVPALHRRPPGEALGVMQAVNTAALKPPFMVLFFGAALSAAAVVAVELFTTREVDAWRLGGALLSLGSFVVTAAYNVPLNRTMAELDPAVPSDRARWPSLIGRWAAGNHVRFLLSTAGLAAFVIAGSP